MGDDGFEEGSNDLVAMVTGKPEDALAEKATVSPVDLNFHEMNIDDTSEIENKQYETAALPSLRCGECDASSLWLLQHCTS